MTMKTVLLSLHGLAVAALLAAQSADAKTQLAANPSALISPDQLGAVAGKQ